MRRAATQLAHRASRLTPATTSGYAGAGWVPTDGSGSPGQRAGCGLATAGGACLHPAQPSHARLGAASGPTFASSSFATAAPTKPATPPPDVDTVNALFIEAREELEYAAEDAGTTYAGESYTAAAAAVAAAGDAYAAFIASLPEEARGPAQRGMGMKFEQLRAELAAVDPGGGAH